MRTELVFILDKSGSMSGLESDTIGGYNALLKKQQQEPGEAVVTTILFDDGYEVLHNRVDIKNIRPITDKEYVIGGCTALLDAVGKTINMISAAQRKSSTKERADKVMVVITTDGMENASREYSYRKIKKMVEQQQREYGWEFIFLGANIDAISTAARFGIGAARAANYHADCQGTLLNYEVVSNAVSAWRANLDLDPAWKADIEADFEGRDKRNRG